ITLTKRGRHQGEDIPMCGVPVHAADDYLQTLIRKGFRVAVCEQMEDPAEAKKRGSKAVVKRDVTRLVTRGTLTEDTLLDARRANYLMALGRSRNSGADEFAAAWTDISTGQLFSSDIPEDTIGSEIARLQPGEILIPETLESHEAIAALADGCALTPLPPQQFDSASGERRLKETFSVGAIEGFGQFSRAETGALGALIGYIDLTQRGRLPALSPPRHMEAGRSMLIDQATRANLELAQTLSGARDGSLLSHIDLTVTGAGARALAARLLSPSTDIGKIGARLDAVAYFTDAETLRADLRAALRSIPEMMRPLSRLSLGRGAPRDLGALKAGLAGALALPRLIEAPQTLAPPPDEIAAAIQTLEGGPHQLLARLQAALAEELPVHLSDGGVIAPGQNSELDEARTLRDQTRQVIAGLQSRYQDATGVKPLKVKHNNVLGYFVEVPAAHAPALQEAGGGQEFIHRQTLASQMRFTTGELAELEVKISEAAGRALAIEAEMFAELVSEVTACASSITHVSNSVASLDVAAALAELAVLQRYCRPAIEDSAAFEIKEGRHPVVEQAQHRSHAGAFVANDCRLTAAAPGRGALCLLTGPNMAGKSTFLRQNALIAILAQMGSFVPASQATIGIVDRLFSRVGASDDLAGGRSTFMVEMVETAAILNQAGPRSLVILDEIGRGTATFDGLAIAWATLEHLHEINRCRTLFATHFHELTALNETLAHVVNMTMRVREHHGDVVFLHEVVPGAADRSYGVQVARLAGLPQTVTARAGEVLDLLEKSGKSSDVAALADDLPLFSATRPAARPAGQQDEMTARLASLAPDELT
ncbi:MAG: DNA mismatch repair protein MutS, partial [Rhizobiales bacterium]|nr:DNA mismatch repair protein MutS [Hyphomicrobiales bacterium]